MSKPWVRLEADTFSNPKIIELAGQGKYRAIVIYIASICWAGSHESDGLLPRGVVKILLGATPSNARDLVKIGLWTEESDGWKIVNFLEYQPSRATLAERSRNAKRAAQIRWGLIDPDESR